MPDGFDPHRELERIYTLRDLMQSCRERVPKILDVIDECLMDENPNVRLAAASMAMDRGFGKPRQHVMINDTGGMEQKRVVVLPDNGRDRVKIGPVIDSDVV